MDFSFTVIVEDLKFSQPNILAIRNKSKKRKKNSVYYKTQSSL